MSEYIIFWKEEPGQQVNTTVDAHDEPVHRDLDYINTNDIRVLITAPEVFEALKSASGDKFAITPELARDTLGWEV